MNDRYKGWIIGIIVGLIVFTGIIKIMESLFNSDMMKIIVNAICQGLGSGVGIYLANRLLIEHLEKGRKNGKKLP